ncbi:hypothetical protein [Roseivirga misakiensis]|uniref:Uncharacterized protein n=1 Tax=Roseivirga misakiensis TaxID=1563681 RepID=A0A1E5T1Q7_9BACT|nr:hypothetical protein [Roseivirga misakiensis]OEK05296.1 hypothetical protein BFP71_18025 [Roseivirga misakiensis]
MRKKGVFLFLLIILPAAIFVFLKIFGRNEFTIPVYYEQGLTDSLPTPCLDRTPQQYIVNNEFVPQGGLKVIHFERLDGPVLKTRLEALERVQDVFYDEKDIALSTFLNGNSIQKSDITDYDKRIQFLDQFWTINQLDSTRWSNLKYCSMAMSNLDNRVVLVDGENKIRGYYNILEREETDRLILELRILKSK